MLDKAKQVKWLKSMVNMHDSLVGMSGEVVAFKRVLREIESGTFDAPLTQMGRDMTPWHKLRDDYEALKQENTQLKALPVARTLEEWHEDYGDVLWWTFPIEEPPYCGSPLDSDWPDYHTHWTPLIIPTKPIGGTNRD